MIDINQVVLSLDRTLNCSRASNIENLKTESQLSSLVIFLYFLLFYVPPPLCSSTLICELLLCLSIQRVHVHFYNSLYA